MALEPEHGRDPSRNPQKQRGRYYRAGCRIRRTRPQFTPIRIRKTGTSRERSPRLRRNLSASRRFHPDGNGIYFCTRQRRRPPRKRSPYPGDHDRERQTRRFVPSQALPGHPQRPEHRGKRLFQRLFQHDPRYRRDRPYRTARDGVRRPPLPLAEPRNDPPGTGGKEHRDPLRRTGDPLRPDGRTDDPDRLFRQNEDQLPGALQNLPLPLRCRCLPPPDRSGCAKGKNRPPRHLRGGADGSAEHPDRQRPAGGRDSRHHAGQHAHRRLPLQTGLGGRNRPPQRRSPLPHHLYPAPPSRCPGRLRSIRHARRRPCRIPLPDHDEVGDPPQHLPPAGGDEYPLRSGAGAQLFSRIETQREDQKPLRPQGEPRRYERYSQGTRGPSFGKRAGDHDLFFRYAQFHRHFRIARKSPPSDPPSQYLHGPDDRNHRPLRGNRRQIHRGCDHGLLECPPRRRKPSRPGRRSGAGAALPPPGAQRRNPQ